LSDRAIAAWLKRGTPGTLRDGASLYLVGAARGAVWRYDFRHPQTRRENTYTVGKYGTGEGQYTLADARKERDKVKAWLDAGLDPNLQKRADKARRVAEAGETFEKVAREYLAKKKGEWSPSHFAAQRRLIEPDPEAKQRVDPDLAPLGPLPIAELNPQTILAVLERIEARGSHEMARKARQFVSLVCRYGVITGRRNDDPAEHLGKALKKAPVRHQPTVEADEMPRLFEALDATESELSSKLALYFQIATATRPSEPRLARWSEIRDDGVWVIPRERMKMRRDFKQPLSALALKVLKRAAELRQTNRANEFLFPGFGRRHGGALAENTSTGLITRAGYHRKQSAHGFRSAFASWAHERAQKERVDSAAVEMCLAHRVGGVRQIYDRSEYLEQRRRIMALWGKQLEAWGMRLP
jgi:integrase